MSLWPRPRRRTRTRTRACRRGSARAPPQRAGWSYKDAGVRATWHQGCADWQGRGREREPPRDGGTFDVGDGALVTAADRAAVGGAPLAQLALTDGTVLASSTGGGGDDDAIDDLGGLSALRFFNCETHFTPPQLAELGRRLAELEPQRRHLLRLSRRARRARCLATRGHQPLARRARPRGGAFGEGALSRGGLRGRCGGGWLFIASCLVVSCVKERLLLWEAVSV